LPPKKDDRNSDTAELKEKFREVLAGRYDVELKLLNLSGLASDAGLQATGVFDGNTSTVKIFPALMAVCDGLFSTRREKRDAIVSVSLTDNNLTNVSEVKSLADTFPDIKNLDLSRNGLSSSKSLEIWRSKFRGLERLLLAGNPVESQLPTLKDEILRWYPSLQSINGVQLRSIEEAAASRAVAAAKSMPIPIFGPSFRDVDQVGETFVRQFIPLYDTNRDAVLSAYYDDQSVYSLAVNMSAPRCSDLAVAAWGEYTKHSRNMTKITTLTARMNRQYRGIQAIRPVWSSLPKTHHPDLGTQGDKYIIECHPIPGLPDPAGQSPVGVDGLIITIHGEFDEEEAVKTCDKAIRSFDRTFILGPGPPGGLPIRVVSDTLSLRAWAPLVLPLPQNTVAPVATQSATPTEQQIQEGLAMQLMEKTGMNMQYSGMCLVETGWNLEQAFNVFTANKVFILHTKIDYRLETNIQQDKLPAEAFLPGAAH
jgi:nuclear RNA export factor